MAYIQAQRTSLSTSERVHDLVTWLFSLLDSAGWTVHDNISTYVKVYKSTGEEGTKPETYIKIDGNTDIYAIYHTAYGYWNNSTHTGLCPSYTGGSGSYSKIIVSASYFYHFLGDKNYCIVFSTTAAQLTYWAFFGFIPTIYWNPYTTLTASVTAGTAKTLTVVSTADFKNNKFYMLFDPSNGTTEKVFVSNILSSTQLVISTLSNNYASGTRIALSPFSFFGASGGGGTTEIYFICGGTDDYDNLYLMETETDTVAGATNIYQSDICCNITANIQTDSSIYGTTKAKIGNFQSETYPNIIATPSYYNTSIYAIRYNSPALGQGSTVGTATTLIDSAKSWTTNQYSGDTVTITAGTGEGQIRKISSNTGTVLTVANNFTVIPDNTSIYEIVKRVYIPLKNYSAHSFGYAIINHDIV